MNNFVCFFILISFLYYLIIFIFNYYYYYVLNNNDVDNYIYFFAFSYQHYNHAWRKINTWITGPVSSSSHLLVWLGLVWFGKAVAVAAVAAHPPSDLSVIFVGRKFCENVLTTLKLLLVNLLGISPIQHSVSSRQFSLVAAHSRCRRRKNHRAVQGFLTFLLNMQIFVGCWINNEAGSKQASSTVEIENC